MNNADFIDTQSRTGIPQRFINSTFENYKHIPKSLSTFNHCKEYAGNANLILLGNVGTGKSHLACAIINNNVRLGNVCRYIPFYQINDIKINQQPRFIKLLECKILVIDEFGIQGSDFKMNTFFEIINERYNNDLSTVIISNLDINHFKQHITEPIYSRLKSNVSLFTCNWNDYRVK